MKIELKYFSDKEFGKWADKMSLVLLVLLNALREQTGFRITLSPVKGAIGRNDGENGTSQHNFDKWGEVLAVDFNMEHEDGTPLTADEALEVCRKAKRLGFNGIGVYTAWKQGPGFHMDVRDVDDFRSWGWVGDVDEKGNQIYVGFDVALKQWGE